MRTTLAVAMAFVAGVAAAEPKKPQAPTATVDDYAGHWEGDWGSLLVRPAGDEVWATYSTNDGIIVAKFDGGIVKGRWNERGDWGEVEFRIVFDANRPRLDGRWRVGDSGPWNDNWDVGRTPAPIAPVLAERFADHRAFPGLRKQAEPVDATADDFVGHWSSTWGDHVFRAMDGAIFGVYHSAWIVGHIDEDGVLRAWWWSNESSQGECEFTVKQTPNGTRVIDGRWRDGAKGEWQTGWDLERLGTPPPADLAGRFSDRKKFVPHP